MRSFRTLSVATVAVLLVGLAVLVPPGPAECANYKGRTAPMVAALPHAESSGGEISLYVDEYATESKSKKAFDSNLAGKGVLALLVRVVNNGQEPCEIAVRDFVVRDASSTLRRIPPEEAAGKVKLNAAARAIGWSLIVPIVAIPVAASMSVHDTNKKNARMKEDFAASVIQDGTIPAYGEQTGFLFYDITGRKDLRGLELAMTARNSTTRATITVVAPLPYASFKSPRGGSKSADGQQGAPDKE